MATVAQHTFVKNNFERFETPIDLNTVINQGDMVFAGADGKSLPMSAGSGLQFLGVAEDTNPVTSLGDKRTQLTVVRRGTFRFKTTVGESYIAYAALYAGADAQTVTTESSGLTAIGFVCPEQAGKTDRFPIAGAAGVMVDVIIKPTHPDAAV